MSRPGAADRLAESEVAPARPRAHCVAEGVSQEVPADSVGEPMGGLLRLRAARSAEDMENHIEFLNHWRSGSK